MIKVSGILGELLLEHAAGNLMLRIPFLIVRKVLGLNHFIHDTAFRDGETKQVCFINFWCGKQSVIFYFI